MAVLYIKDVNPVNCFQIETVNASEHQLFTLTIYSIFVAFSDVYIIFKHQLK